MSQYATDGTPNLPLVTPVVTFCPLIAHETDRNRVRGAWFVFSMLLSVCHDNASGLQNGPAKRLVG